MTMAPTRMAIAIASPPKSSTIDPLGRVSSTTRTIARCATPMRVSMPINTVASSAILSNTRPQPVSTTISKIVQRISSRRRLVCEVVIVSVLRWPIQPLWGTQTPEARIARYIYSVKHRQKRGRIRMMATDTVLEVKNKLSIQEVVAPYVKLHRAGKSLVGLCPFHKEKTPSFHVSPERASYHCFGCGEGGDMFSFIEKVEGVDFKGALKILAEKAGVPLEYSPRGRETAGKRDRLYALMARAAQWYTGHLKGSPAEAYAGRRGDR